MPSLIEQLRSGGFSDQEIGAWSSEKRAVLTQGGFSQAEIDEYLAGPKEPVPPALVERIDKPDAKPDTEIDLSPYALSETPTVDFGFGNFAKGLWAGITKPGAELKKELEGAGPGETAGALIGRVPLGQIADQIRQGGESLEATMSGQPVSAEEMVGNALLGLTAPVTRLPGGGLMRLERHPVTGEPRQVPLGDLPKHEDFSSAAREITQGDVPLPEVTEKLHEIYRKEGVLPAEVLHDARSDPTIAQDLLTQGADIPEVYRNKTRPSSEIIEEPREGQSSQVATAVSEEPREGISSQLETKPNQNGRPEGGVNAAARELAEPETADFRTPQPGAPSAGMSLGAAARRLTDDEATIMGGVDVGGTRKRPATTMSSLYASVFDRLNAIPDRDAAGKLIEANENPYRLYRLTAGSPARAEGWLKLGQVEFESGNKIGPSLEEILQPKRHSLDSLRAYISSARAIELEGKGIKTGFDLDAARRVVAAGEKEFGPTQEKLVSFQNNLTKYLRDSGILSPKAYESMTAAHTAYVPFHAVLDAEARHYGGGGMQPDNPLFRIEGSTRVKIDPLESIVQHTHQYVAMSERNRAAQALIDLLDKSGETKLATAKTAAENQVRVFVGGVEKHFEVHPDIAAAVKNVDADAAAALQKWLSSDNALLRGAAKAVVGPAKLLRAGSTLAPDFMLRNIIRDYLTALVQSEKPVFTPIDSIKGFMSAVTRDEYFRRWTQGGGGNAELMAIDRRYLQEGIRKLTTETGLGNRAWNVVRHPIEALRAFSALSEQATRLGEFRFSYDKAIREGATPQDASIKAAYASREVTVDFARTGSITRPMNMIAAFFNAQLQGADRFARQLRDHPVSASVKIAGGIVLPSILLWLNNKDDPRYHELPAWQRDMFWIVPTDDWRDFGPAESGQQDTAPYAKGGASFRVRAGRVERNEGVIIRVPKPFEVGILFGSGIERMLDAFFTQYPDRLGDYATSVWGMLSPNVLPTVAVPFIEQFSNRSLFTGNKLVPQYREGMLPEYAYEPYTTELAKKIGAAVGAFPGIRSLENVPVVSGVARALSTPILFEQYWRDWGGTGGKYLLEAVDAGLRNAGILPNPPRPDDTLSDVPFIKAFVVRYPSASTDSIRHFYDELAVVKENFTSYMRLMKEGDVEAAKRVQEAGGTRMFVNLNGIQEAMGVQAKMIRDITANPRIPSAQKRQMIDSIYYGQIQLAQTGLKALEQVDKTRR